MRNYMWTAVAVIILCAGCATPDKRISASIDVIKNAQETQARNTDRIWTAFISQYREKEMAIIDGFYEADQRKADGNLPKRETFPTVEAYAEDLIKYASERQIFLSKSEAIRKRNIGKLDAKIATAQATYDATKKNRESYNKLVQLLRDYEDAKIDPVAVAPIVTQLISTFIPVDTVPAPRAIKPNTIP